MIPIFDLDDTLYPEIEFVKSGFRAVAVNLRKEFGWAVEESYAHMLATLAKDGRGAVFNSLLMARGALSSARVRQCVAIYRHHLPEIFLAPAAEHFLSSLKVKPYLVTDGHKIAQYNKVKALGIEPRFNKIYITHRYGIAHAKPSIYCFELIRRRERCQWQDMYYVGDNPSKDFVNLNSVGVTTIRVKTGEHANVIAKPGFEANYSIDSLDDLEQVLKEVRK